MFFGTVECSTVQCTTVDNTAVYCSTQYGPLQHSVLHCITVYYNMVKYIPITTMQCTTVQYTVLQCTVQCAVEFYSYSSFLIFQELFGRMLFPEEPSQPPGGPSSQRQPCLTEKVTLHLHTCSHTHTCLQTCGYTHFTGLLPVLQAPSCGWLRAGRTCSVFGIRMESCVLLLYFFLLR